MFDFQAFSYWSCHYWRIILELSGKIQLPSSKGSVVLKRSRADMQSYTRASPVLKRSPSLFSTTLVSRSGIELYIQLE